MSTRRCVLAALPAPSRKCSSSAPSSVRPTPLCILCLTLWTYLQPNPVFAPLQLFQHCPLLDLNLEPWVTYSLSFHIKEMITPSNSRIPHSRCLKILDVPTLSQKRATPWWPQVHQPDSLGTHICYFWATRAAGSSPKAPVCDNPMSGVFCLSAPLPQPLAQDTGPNPLRLPWETHSPQVGSQGPGGEQPAQSNQDNLESV